jgi:hypothetical protein
MKSLLMVFLAICFVYTPALAARDPWHQGAPSHSLAAKYGWGCDGRIRVCYVGPIWARSGKGYFRCFAPGVGWQRCP